MPKILMFCFLLIPALAFSEPLKQIIEEDPWAESEWETEEESQQSWLRRHNITGFAELRYGHRTQSAIHQRQTSLAEWRLKLDKETSWQGFNLNTNIDLLYDDIEPSQQLQLDSGNGWLDIREFVVQKRIANTDLKLGRQIMTWGVGDLVFINDLFPKDWNSFLIGRDEQYLKAPSDALRIGFYTELMNIDLAITPEFDADRYIDGRRLSYFNSTFNTIAGQNAVITTDQPHGPEIALRLYKNIGAYEYAFYGYDGFWKSPAGFNIAKGKAIFPKLTVLGASLRGPLANGIVSLEIGNYHSSDDSHGTNPDINNSEIRGLVAYEWSPFHNATTNVQYYVEALQHYRQYKQSMNNDDITRDQYRHLLSTRFTYLSHQQNLTWSLFIFYSPSDHDAYLRPRLTYKATDNWQLEAGLNLFSGQKQHTFFGQFEHNSNSYISARYHF